MKNTLLILGLALFCGCASAEPPDHKPAPVAATNAVMTLVVPAGVPIDGVICYAANHADTNWLRIKYVQAMPGNIIATTVPVYDEYTATTTNSATGQESDYAPKFIYTNAAVLLALPAPALQVAPAQN